MDKYTYDILTLLAQWAALAQWIAAFGTVGATITALCLARRDRNVKMDIYCEINKIIYKNTEPDQDLDIISINITNLGYRDIIIQKLYWKIPFVKGGFFIKSNQEFSWSSIIPTKLTEGGIAYFPVKLNNFEESAKVLINKIKFFPSVLLIRI